VDHRVAANQGALKRLRIRQVTLARFPSDAFKVGKIARAADEQAQIGPLRGECAGYMASDKPSRPSKEYFHR
jgi:hypothetical protein